MKKYALLFLSFLLLISSCEVFNEVRFQSTAKFSEKSITTIPFEYKKQLIIVQTSVNGKEPCNFLFDTGAFQSKIEFSLAKSLELVAIGSRSNGTAQGIEREIEIVNIDTINFSGTKWFDIAAGKLQYDSTSFSPCVAEDGIIGSNLIKLANWKIDYQQKTMQFSTEPFIVSEDKQIQIKFKTPLLSGVPLITLSVGGRIVEDVIFDLGYNGGLVLPYRYSKHFETAGVTTVIDQSTTGIFGTSRDTLHIKSLELSIEEYQCEIPVEFSSLNKALIGNDFLEHFTIYINYKGKTITLVPQEDVVVEKSKLFIPGVLNDSLWVVNRTTTSSPLEIGDTLRFINGWCPKDLFSSHCDYFYGISDLLKSDSLRIMMSNQTITIEN